MRSRNVKHKRADLYKKNTSLSLLEEVNPVNMSFPGQKTPSSVKMETSPNFTVSPISKPKVKTVERKSKVLSSTPIRKGEATKNVGNSLKASTFSHVLVDWQNGYVDENGISEQNRVIELVKSGINVYCTGGAGTGKSHLLRKLVGILPPSETAVMATTGVAASLIGGTTVHAFSGVGHLLDREDLEDLSPNWLEITTKRIISDPRIMSRWKTVRRIIIDEVSMLSCRAFSRLEAVARIAREKYEEKIPFGGVQVVAFGDFFQLPPVLTQSTLNIVKKKFAFQSSVWRACCFTCVELKTSWRQSGDPKFSKLLNEIRLGHSPRWVIETLRSRVFPESKDVENGKIPSITTRLCTHRRDAEKYNNEKLMSLKGAIKVFEARDIGPQHLISESFSNVPSKIELKVGAQVMLLRNLDVTRGLVNGARGVIESFTAPSEGGFPVVRFFNSKNVSTSVIIYRERWTSNTFQAEAGSKEVQVARLQLPLCLAWAISIHKSQGITLDSVEVDLTKVFEHGQAYVALSRCQSLAGLRLLSWRSDFIRVDNRVIDFYKEMNAKPIGLLADFDMCL
nr:ATP dependent DNA helicase PIF1 [Hymenolepis microstoma]